MTLVPEICISQTALLLGTLCLAVPLDIYGSQDSSVGMATGYGLDSRQGHEMFLYTTAF
jgi:hypothetical protein